MDIDLIDDNINTYEIILLYRFFQLIIIMYCVFFIMYKILISLIYTYINNPNDKNIVYDPLYNYEYKYVNDFEMMQEDITRDILIPQSRSYLKDKIIIETTPNGDVVMGYTYDEKDETLFSFNYYCDDKNIPFKYLDTVARKYTILHKCPQIFICLKQELKKMREKKNIKETLHNDKNDNLIIQKNNINTNEASVFAVFKNYKKPKKNINNLIIPFNILSKNRYTRMGCIDDYNKTLIKPIINTNIKNISFSDFKKFK
jgi:hypothetical protein